MRVGGLRRAEPAVRVAAAPAAARTRSGCAGERGPAWGASGDGQQGLLIGLGKRWPCLACEMRQRVPYASKIRWQGQVATRLPAHIRVPYFLFISNLLRTTPRGHYSWPKLCGVVQLSCPNWRTGSLAILAHWPWLGRLPASLRCSTRTERRPRAAGEAARLTRQSPGLEGVHHRSQCPGTHSAVLRLVLAGAAGLANVALAASQKARQGPQCEAEARQGPNLPVALEMHLGALTLARSAASAVQGRSSPFWTAAGSMPACRWSRVNHSINSRTFYSAPRVGCEADQIGRVSCTALH